MSSSVQNDSSSCSCDFELKVLRANEIQKYSMSCDHAVKFLRNLSGSTHEVKQITLKKGEYSELFLHYSTNVTLKTAAAYAELLNECGPSCMPKVEYYK